MAVASLTPPHLSLLRAVAQTPNKSPNWAKIAEEADFSAAKGARDMWAMVRKKLEAKDGNINLTPRQADLLRVY
ncbi:hypothetical protein LTR95_018786, partial [Oleoguttula sp. CCFEE 5521]